MGINLWGGSGEVQTASGTLLDNMFAGGGTIMMRIFQWGWGEGGLARFWDKSDGEATTTGWTLLLDQTAGTLEFRHSFGTTNGVWTVPWGAPDNVTWLFLKYDRDDVNNDPEIWTETVPGNGEVGSLTVTRVTAPVGSADDDSSLNFRLGQLNGVDTRTMASFATELRVYNRLLQENEMSSIGRAQGADCNVFGLVYRCRYMNTAPLGAVGAQACADDSVNNIAATADVDDYAADNWEGGQRRRAS